MRGGDERGATIVEFAIVAPVFLTLLLGIFDFGHAIYAQSVLQGAFILAKAKGDPSLARDSVIHLRRYVLMLFGRRN